MERMLVVVFDSETQAYEGSAALHQLEQEGNLSIYAGAVVAKNADGTAAIRQAEDFGPFGTLLGTSVGSLIGLRRRTGRRGGRRDVRPRAGRPVRSR